MDKWEDECSTKVLEEAKAFAKKKEISLKEALLVLQLNQLNWISSELSKKNENDIYK